MNTEIKVGTKVICPVTDASGEVAFQTGTLVVINSRMAHVKFSDGSIVKVGKTKIEVFAEEPEVEIKAAKKESSPNKGKYVSVRAASGRKSLDRDDATARMLRGLTLDEVYSTACHILDRSIDEMKLKYSGLNPGHQRMILGNMIRNRSK